MIVVPSFTGYMYVKVAQYGASLRKHLVMKSSSLHLSSQEFFIRVLATQLVGNMQLSAG
jgi:hypothetical protein